MARNESSITYKYCPKSGPCLASISAHSFKTLEPAKYLNDEIIQFYMAYLRSQACSSEIAKKVHVFDNIFHNLLIEVFDGPQINRDKWKTLDRWFKGVQIFDKDYLIFPICKDEHWSAIIVCHPSEVLEGDIWVPQETVDIANNSPGIIVLDSLRMNNRKISKHVRQFLDYEWRTKKERKVKDFGHHSIKEYHPQLAQQANAYDCGIFLLAYLKAFILEPQRFYRYVRRAREEDTEKLTKMVNDALASCSRPAIIKLIEQFCRSEGTGSQEQKRLKDDPKS